MTRGRVLSLVAVVAALLAPASASAAPSAHFYTPPTLSSQEPGAIIRSEPMSAVLDPVLRTPYDATATRIMYVSTDLDGAPIPVTGSVITPNRPWDGAGPRPLVSLAPGTYGQGDRCAPSHALEGGYFLDAATLGALLARGARVVVTDYRGLGTTGTPTYLNRVQAAHAVLDAARAAQKLFGPSPVGIGGYSQGGFSAAAAVELQPEYAPELAVVGAFAGAVPADLTAQFRSGSELLKPIYLDFVSGLIEAYPPAAQAIRAHFNGKGLDVLLRTQAHCDSDNPTEFDNVTTPELTSDGRPLMEVFGEEPFASLISRQRIGLTPPRAPVLLFHAAGDDTIPVEQARELARMWCSEGATVDYTEIPVPEAFPGTQLMHALPSFAASWLGADYLAARFAGVPAPSTCQEAGR